MYMKVFSQQTMTDISPGGNVPHWTGEIIILVPKNNKYPFFTQFFGWNFHTILSQFLRSFWLKKSKMQNNKICVFNPVVSINFWMMIYSIR